MKAHRPTCLCVDYNNFAYIGYDDGTISRIDILSYKVTHEFRIGKFINFIDVSKNNKHILISYINEEKEQMVSLIDNKLNIVQNYEQSDRESPARVFCGFNLTAKKIFICWTYRKYSKIQVFIMSDNE